MKWFNEHLNITYGVIVVLSIVISMVGLFVIMKDIKDFNQAWLAVIIVCAFIPLFASIWVLYQKKQSMWWLLIYLVFSFALIVLALVLPNNRKAQGEAKKISEADYYKQREASNK